MNDSLPGASIVAVTVYPDRARVTRRGRFPVTAGDQRVVIGPLPLGLHHDSVRVAGRGPATVLGVDVAAAHHARSVDAEVAALEEERRGLDRELAELVDADGVQAQVGAFLERLGERAGGSYARALAKGDADPAGLATFADSLAERLSAVRDRQRELADRRSLLADRLAALDRRLAEMVTRRAPDRLAATVGLEVAQDGEVELELSYVVGGAGWESGYDVRLVDEALTLTWYGLVRQQTGEDWPECDLRLSTARPAAVTGVPELDPWFLDRARPVTTMRTRDAAFSLARAAAPGSGLEEAVAYPAQAPAPELRESVATVEQGVAAATYRPARPVAVPADGTSHRATVATLDLSAALDYVTAPVHSPDAHLRATVTNDSSHTLLPGRASVFHGGDFVGAVNLPVWAPGEEVELALGVDDRVRVEREMVRRGATRATLGSTRRRDVDYLITVANHTPRPARVTVLDQTPVSRDDQITVKEVRTDPEPAERTDLGVLTWRLELAAGQTREVRFGFRVELAKGVTLAGWRE